MYIYIYIYIYAGNYGSGEDGVARFCAEHKLASHIDVAKRCCQVAYASIRIAYVNIRQHTSASHIDVAKRCCQVC